MAIKSYKMGPGVLTFGTAPTQDASAQVTNCRVECSESVKSVDAIPVLSGEQLAQQDTVTLSWKLSGSVIQDIQAADLVAYTWTKASQVVAFKFTPSTAEARAVTGQVRIVPLTLGGDVDSRNKADLSWQIVGTPVIGVG